MKFNPSAITNSILRPIADASRQGSQWGEHVANRRKMLCGGLQDRLYPRVTINVLPDNVLLDTFEIYLGKDDPDSPGLDFWLSYDKWHTLVHVCGRWRCIVFASPRRLDLKLCCPYSRRPPSSKMLDIWPALPVVILSQDMGARDVTTVIAALRQYHSRLCKMYYRDERFPDSLLNAFAAIDEPFPALTNLRLESWHVAVLPDSFLGESASRLRSLDLKGIAYPSIGNLLLSTTNLVRLSLCRIPYSGYIPPETIVPILSTLSGLELLHLGFQHPRYQAHGASRHPPPLIRAVFSSLTFLYFKGDIEYLEDILSQIETPVLNQSTFLLFNQLVFDTPLLGQFIRHMGIYTTTHRACVHFSYLGVVFRLPANGNKDGLCLEISCKPLDWQLSAVAQVLDSFSSPLPTLESLEIQVHHEDWKDEIEVTQWREFLHPFTFVKELTLGSEDSFRLVAPPLQELTGERETGVLPALETLFLGADGCRPSGPGKEAMEQFIGARQLCGHPLTVHYWDSKSRMYVR